MNLVNDCFSSEQAVAGAFSVGKVAPDPLPPTSFPVFVNAARKKTNSLVADVQETCDYDIMLKNAYGAEVNKKINVTQNVLIKKAKPIQESKLKTLLTMQFNTDKCEHQGKIKHIKHHPSTSFDQILQLKNERKLLTPIAQKNGGSVSCEVQSAEGVKKKTQTIASFFEAFEDISQDEVQQDKEEKNNIGYFIGDAESDDMDEILNMHCSSLLLLNESQALEKADGGQSVCTPNTQNFSKSTSKCTSDSNITSMVPVENYELVPVENYEAENTNSLTDKSDWLQDFSNSQRGVLRSFFKIHSELLAGHKSEEEKVENYRIQVKLLQQKLVNSEENMKNYKNKLNYLTTFCGTCNLF
jgi:hypothetical protein